MPSLLLLLLLAVPLCAHNGAVAIAVPVEGIAVDGDFSDWPDDAVWYPLDNHFYAAAPLDDDDYSGRFTAGYNIRENALYFAVEARDESILIARENPKFDSGDGCELYLDLPHDTQNTMMSQYHIHGDQSGVYNGWSF